MARLAEFRDAGITGATISRLEEAGEITRLTRGLYQLPNAKVDANHTLAQAAKLRCTKTGIVPGPLAANTRLSPELRGFESPSTLLALVSAAMGKSLLTQTPDAVAEDLDDDDEDDDSADGALEERAGNA